MDAKLAAIREQMPGVDAYVYLNTGTAGPLPRKVHAAMAQSLEAQLQQGRCDFSAFVKLFEVYAETRSALAGLLGCDAEEIAITHNTTDGMNLATMGINWQPGDEAITTNLEHPGVLFPLFAARDRFGITIKVADVEGQPERAAEVIGGMITPRTKAISLSHVAFTTGAILPVREICEVAHAHGVLVLVDGAQSFAAMPVDVRALGCDAYAGPGQKWICGPEGTGVLYVARNALSEFKVTTAGYFSVDKYSTYGGMVLKDTAQRFEQGTVLPANIIGLLTACRWLTEDVGADYAFSRIRSLARRAWAGLRAIPGVTVLTPAETAGLVTFQVQGVKPDDVVARLKERNMVARTVPHPAAVRVATGYYNTEDEVDQVIAAVAAML